MAILKLSVKAKAISKIIFKSILIQTKSNHFSNKIVYLKNIDSEITTTLSLSSFSPMQESENLQET